MKKTTRFSLTRAVMTLLLVLCSSTAWSQDELTVYDGTTTNNYVPAYIFYFDDFTRSQFVIPAADLEDMENSKINSLKFYTNASNVPYTTLSTAVVYLKEVDYTSINEYEETATCSTVYQGTLSIVTEGSGGSLTIEFSTPFDYHGGNLLIGIENIDDNGYKRIYFYGQTVEGASIADSNGSSLENVGVTQHNFIPKTTFTYEDPNGFFRPKYLQVDDLDTHTATLSWTSPSENVTGYVYQYKKESDAEWSEEANTTDTSVTLSALSQETAYNFRVKAMYDTGESKYAEIDFTTLIAIYAPTDVVISNILWDQVDIDWTDNNAEGTTWEIAYSDQPDFEPGTEGELIQNVTSHPFTLTGLDMQTSYEVYVRAINGEEVSRWSDMGSFTIPTRYVVPTGLTSENITIDGATITWEATDEAESYNLRYRPYVNIGGHTYDYDFDDSSFDGWTTIDADGDGYTWELGSNPVSYLVEGGSLADTGHGGSHDLVVSGSYRNTDDGGVILTPDNYLVSPRIILEGSISFWACAQDNSWPAEHFAVAVSTISNDNPADFTTIASSEQEMTAVKKRLAPVKVGPRKVQGNWYQYEVDLSEFSGWGYVAIRHFNCEDQFMLDVDDIQIIEGIEGTPEPWTTIEGITDTSKELTGLEPDTQYEVQVLANYEGGHQSEWTASHTFLTLPKYLKPTNLQVSNVEFYEATLSWDAGQEDQTAWEVAYMAETDDDFTIISGVTTTEYTLTELAPDTKYLVKVRGNHGEGEYSQWTDFVIFKTLNPAAPPFNLVAEDITHTDAELTWEGVQDVYDLRWRKAAYQDVLLKQDFEDGLDGWLAISNNTVNNAEIRNDNYKSGTCCFRFSSYSSVSDAAYDQFLISPELTESGTLRFYYKTYGFYGPESFVIGYSSTGNDIDDFTWDSSTETSTSTTEWTEFTYDIPDGTKYVAIHYTSVYRAYLYIDDIANLGQEHPAEEWQLVEEQTSPYLLSQLEVGTEYEWQVMGKNPDTEWSEISSFTTISDNIKFFIADGDWDDENNWLPIGVPNHKTDVIIKANAIVPAGVIAYAKNITMDGGSITLKDLAELKTTTDGLTLNIEKDITAEQYYLLSSPINEYMSFENVQNLLDGTYDLYTFSQTDGNEWNSIKRHGMAMTSGTGFLYANSTSRTLTFSGPTSASINNSTINNVIFDDSSTEFYNGWMLIGNPYPCTAYLYCLDNNLHIIDIGGKVFPIDEGGNDVPEGGKFYKLNDSGTFDVYTGSVQLAPCESAFIRTFENSFYEVSTEDLGVEPNKIGEVDYPTLPELWQEEDQDAAPTFYLADDDDNSDLFDEFEGYSGIYVGIDGRTILTDGRWNTICLPFDLTLEGSPLEGATARTLEYASYDDHVLTLNFGDPVTMLEAGVPYIIKWDPSLSDNIVNPLFNFIDNAANIYSTPTFDEVDEIITFVGTYAPVTFNNGNRRILILGGNNKLFFPDGTAPSWVNAFRGYFQLNENYLAGDTDFAVKFNFNDNEPTAIYNITGDNQPQSVYDLSGRRISNPQRGIYIVNGKKVLVK